LRYMELRNYRKFRQAAVEFPEGIVGIIGRNGSGKSSLVEAIAWAIYGNEGSIVRTGKEGVKFSGAWPNEDCSVTLEFELEGESYRLQRIMKGQRNALDASLTVNGKLLAKGDTAVTDAMIERLGMDHRAFFVSVFAKQKDLNALSSLRAEERRKLVRRMLEVDVLDKVVTEIDKDARLIESELKGLQASLVQSDGGMKHPSLLLNLEAVEISRKKLRSEMEELRTQLISFESKVEEKKGNRSLISAIQERYRSARDDLMRKEMELKARERSEAELEGELRSLGEKKEELARLTPAKEEYEKAEREKEKFENVLRSYEEMKGIQARLSVVDRDRLRIEEDCKRTEIELKELKDPSGHLASVEKNLSEFLEQAKDRSEGAKGKESEARRLQREMDALKKKMEEISRLGPESRCPTCERRMGDQHSSLLTKLGQELSDKSAERKQLDLERSGLQTQAEQSMQRAKALEERRRKLVADREREVELLSRSRERTAQRSQLEAEREELLRRSGEIGDIDFDEARYLQLKGNLTKLRSAADRCQELKAQVQRTTELEKALKNARSVLEVLRQETRSATTKVESIGYHEGDLERAQSEVDGAADAAMLKSKEIARKQAELSGKENEAAAIRGQLEEVEAIEKRASAGTRKLQEQNALSDAMRVFRSEVIARITPALSQISSKLFQELTESKYAGMELNDEYEIEVLDGGKKYPLDRFSGGEADLANLCLRLAISKMISERSGNALNFLILDEIFGSQDQVRKRNIVNAFDQLSKQFSQIVLITHVEDMKDLINGAILVREKEDGSSEVLVTN